MFTYFSDQPSSLSQFRLINDQYNFVILEHSLEGPWVRIMLSNVPRPYCGFENNREESRAS